MIKYLFLAFLLPTFAGNVFAGTFLDELPQDHTISAPVQWQPSPYDEETTPIQKQYSGDKCVEKTQNYFDTEKPASKSGNVECYITQFPNKGIETRVQSSEDGEMSVGVKWDID